MNNSLKKTGIILSKLFPLRNMYVPALALLAIFSILTHYNERLIFATLKNDGAIINIAGRQRMLSQKIVLLAITYKNSPTQQNRQKLQDDVKLMESSHNYLKYYVKEFTPKLMPQQLVYQKYIEDVNALILNPDSRKLSDIRVNSQILLEELSSFVFKYEEHNRNKINDIEASQTIIFALFLLFMLLEIVFIFHPTSEKIKQNTNELQDRITRKTNQLRKSLNLLSTYVIFSRTDKHGVIIEASDAFCDISGYTREELIGKPHSIVRHPDTPSSVFKNLWADLKIGQIHNQQIKNLRKDGTSYWVDAHIAPEYDEDGKIISYVSIREDITANKEVESLNATLEHRVEAEVTKNTLKDKLILSITSQQKEHLNTVIESNNNAIIAVDKTGTILTYNKKAEDIFGFTKEEMLGTKNLLNVIPQKYKKLHAVASQKYFKSGDSNGVINTTVELQGLTKDGNIFPIRISFGSNENIVVANITDISKEKSQEEQLLKQSRLAQMGEMLSMIAHQWRQPLASIASASYSVQAKLRMKQYKLDTPENVNKFLGFIEKKHLNINEYVQFLSTTIDDFRNFLNQDNATETISLSEPINKALQILNDTLQENKITIITELITDDNVNVHTNEIVQVILNLLKNAEDNFVEKNVLDATIWISSKMKNDNVLISISDNGGGIPDDIIEEVFNPYFSTKSQKNGTGLGLYMSKMIIEKYSGGALNVNNENNGVNFEIILEKEKNNE